MTDPDTLLPALRSWLAQAPAMAGVARFWFDGLPTVPGQAGLFPQGVRVAARRQNLLGDTRLRCRCTFTLRLALPAVPGDDAQAAQNAARLLRLRRWVAEQSAAGTAPAFGDDPPAETLAAADARLEALGNGGAEGTAVYRLTLTAEYDEHYPAAGA